MVKTVENIEGIIQLRSWRDELVLSAMRAREKGYFHTADALDKMLLDEMDLISLDTQVVGSSVAPYSQDECPPSPDSNLLRKNGEL